MKFSRVLLGSFLVLALAACGGDGTPLTTDPSDPTTTTDPTDPTSTTDPSDPTVTTDPSDPTITLDPSSPSTTTISGTIIPPSGVTSLTVVVGACLTSNISNGSCSTPFVTGTIQSTGAFSIAGLESASYVVVAQADSDGDTQTVEYQAVAENVTAPATGLTLTLEPLGSDPTDSTDPTDATDPTIPSGTVSGTVTAPTGVSVNGALVAACLSSNPSTCEGRVITTADSTGAYTLTGLSETSYTIVAAIDTNGNSAVDTGDYLGGVPNITPPATNVNITLQVYQGSENAPLGQLFKGVGKPMSLNWQRLP